MGTQLRNELATFLRSCRTRLSPEEAGLQPSSHSRRRVKGLRREEVAALAGISLPWYTSLEQGRDINVSDQVLESLARVLKLNPDEQKHLFYLASPPTIRNEAPRDHSASDMWQYMLDQMSTCPAYIIDDKMNIVAINRLASIVFGFFEPAREYERNIIWRMFMLPDHRDLFLDWEHSAEYLLGHFRVMYVRHIENPWYRDFIAELSEGSTEFKQWWDTYEVQCVNQHPRILAHPKAGMLHLHTHLCQLLNHDDHYLAIFTPDLQDGSAERLAKLVKSSK